MRQAAELSARLDIKSQNDRLQTVPAYATRNLRKPLDLDELAEAACLSRRQFTRLFQAETGTTPARAIEALRLESAQFMLKQSRLPIEAIAREAGFGDRERMGRASLRVRGTVPQSLRTQAGPIAMVEPFRSVDRGSTYRPEVSALRR